MRALLLVPVVVATLAGPALAGRPFERRLYPYALAADTAVDPRVLFDDTRDIPWSGRVSLTLSSLSEVTRIRIRARASCATTLQVTAQPGGAEGQARFVDAPGWQELVVEVALPELDGLDIEGACLDELQLFVTAGEKDHPWVEAAHRKKILAWKREQAENTRFFAAHEDVPFLPRYRYTSREDDRRREPRAVAALAVGLSAEHAAAATLAEGVLDAADPAALEPVALDFVDARRLPPLEGLEHPRLSPQPHEEDDEPGLDLPMLARVGIFDLAGFRVRPRKPSLAPADFQHYLAGAAACRRRTPLHLVWRLQDEASGLTAFLVGRCGIASFRTGEIVAANRQILVYGPTGRLLLVADRSYSFYVWDEVDGRPTIVGGVELHPEHRGVLEAVIPPSERAAPAARPAPPVRRRGSPRRGARRAARRSAPWPRCTRPTCHG